MGEYEFVEMMDMSDSKVERGDENDPRGRHDSEKVQRHHQRAKCQFFRYGTLNNRHR